MLIITRNEAAEVLDVLKQAQEDPMLDELAYQDAIDILSGVLKQKDLPVERYLEMTKPECTR